ncbi:hypothetical protein C7G62_19150 [Acinetobacter baumannii]|uniref:hypothetical protein n=1 Tax=Acinetobacter baumannii TaxID=470 RepID=UPI000D0B9AF0|nr:hypothetical protein [Acinetobacter baumannii]PSD91361.1 hypothetical protein C7G62_19150 [Acinetobacter baumannii]
MDTEALLLEGKDLQQEGEGVLLPPLEEAGICIRMVVSLVVSHGGEEEMFWGECKLVMVEERMIWVECKLVMEEERMIWVECKVV